MNNNYLDDDVFKWLLDCEMGQNYKITQIKLPKFLNYGYFIIKFDQLTDIWSNIHLYKWFTSFAVLKEINFKKCISLKIIICYCW